VGYAGGGKVGSISLRAHIIQWRCSRPVHLGSTSIYSHTVLDFVAYALSCSSLSYCMFGRKRRRIVAGGARRMSGNPFSNPSHKAMRNPRNCCATLPLCKKGKRP
jgi:hypothetical protein